MIKTFHVGVKAVVYDKAKGVLLLLHENGFWDTPGGRIDDNESIEETLTREISEELPNAKLHKIKKLESAFRLQKDILPDISLVMLYYIVDVTLPEEVELSPEHTDHRWVKTLDDMPDLSWNPEMITILKKLLKLY